MNSATRTSEEAGLRPRVCSCILSFLVFTLTPSQPHRVQARKPSSTAVTFDLVHTYQFFFCFVFSSSSLQTVLDSRLKHSLNWRFDFFLFFFFREPVHSFTGNQFSWLVPFRCSFCLFLGFCLLSHSRDTADRQTKVVPVLNFLAQPSFLFFLFLVSLCFHKCICIYLPLRAELLFFFLTLNDSLAALRTVSRTTQRSDSDVMTPPLG